MKVFISMPFTGKTFEDLTQERRNLKALVEKYGHSLPEQFIGYQFEDDFKTKDYDPSFVLGKDKKYIKESDIVIADFSSPSIGTDCEVTLAKELYDKKIIGVVADNSKRKHAWLRFYCDHFVDSIEDGLKLINEKYKDYSHPENVDKRQYDSIAIEYSLIEKTPVQKYVYDQSLLKLTQEYLKNKNVAVFHVATGHRARIIKNAGANQVSGFDSSFKQIHIAKEIENNNPIGISYTVTDVYSKDFIGSLPEKNKSRFDGIVGYFLLDHAQTRIELTQLSQNIYNSLSTDGIFIAMLDDAKAKLPTDTKYGVGIESVSENRGDGEQRKISVYQNMKDGQDRPLLHFFNYEWTRETIQDIFKQVGFQNIEFRTPTVSEDGLNELGTEYWDRYVKNPDNIIFICKK